MTARDRTVVVVVAVVVALAASWLLLIGPKRSQASKLGEQIKAAQSQLDSARSSLASDVGHVLLDPSDRRELVGHALDPNARHGRAGEGGQQHAPQRVAKGVAEAPVERLDRERATVVVDRLA
jgi:type II secretory pathway pseudopilin PulG